MRAAVLPSPGEPPRYVEHPEPLDAPGATVVAMTAAPSGPAGSTYTAFRSTVR